MQRRLNLFGENSRIRRPGFGFVVATGFDGVDRRVRDQQFAKFDFPRAAGGAFAIEAAEQQLIADHPEREDIVARVVDGAAGFLLRAGIDGGACSAQKALGARHRSGGGSIPRAGGGPKCDDPRAEFGERCCSIRSGIWNI